MTNLKTITNVFSRFVSPILAWPLMGCDRINKPHEIIKGANDFVNREAMVEARVLDYWLLNAYGL